MTTARPRRIWRIALNVAIFLGVCALLAGTFGLSRWLANHNDAVTRDGTPTRIIADQAWEANNWTKAANYYEKMLSVDPFNPMARFRLSYALQESFYRELDASPTPEQLSPEGRKLAQAALDSYQSTLDYPEKAELAYYNMACIYARLGDADRAFRDLNKAIELGTGPIEIAKDQDFKSLQADPRYQEIVKDVMTDKFEPKILWERNSPPQ